MPWKLGLDIQDIEIRLLVALDALLEERNLTRAGLRIGLGQPAMSHALMRLRELFGDQLFVRVRTGMEPTPLAIELAAPVRKVLTLLKTSVMSAAAFDALTSTRSFCLLMSDMGMLIYLPKLLSRVQELAPNIDLRILPLHREKYTEAFENGTADLAVGYLPGLQTGFHQRRLFMQDHVCIVGRRHPRITSSLTAEQFCSESHVVVEPAGTSYRSLNEQTTTTLIERWLNEANLHRRVSLRVPLFTLIPQIVASTQLIATVPRCILEYLPEASAIRAFELPAKPPEFEVNLFWHARSHNDPANHWLRSLIAGLEVECRVSDFRSQPQRAILSHA